MRSAKLQAALAKRREAEHIKFQKSAAVERYYDQWGRITSRFESWTTPQYYREAEEALRKREDDKRKAEVLGQRRERLKEMLRRETEQQQSEMEKVSRPKPKTLSTEILEGVRARLNDADEAKRRLDLEAKLYTKWRTGVDQDAVIMESKNAHQAMAKLNWIDRQVQLQLQGERDRKEGQERELRLHEKARRREELLLETNRMREQEMKDLRSQQEVHMGELKNREQEANELKMYEVRLKTKKEELDREVEQLRVYNERRRDRVVAMHNFRRIKMLLRDRSEAVRNDLRHDLQLLQRISMDNPESNEAVGYLRQKFQLQYELEVEQQTTIENMYESEAKHNLSKWEDKWNEEASIREQQLRCLIDDRVTDFEVKLMECRRRQRELIDIRETHIKAIDGASQRLKELMTAKSRDDCVISPNSAEIRELLVQRDYAGSGDDKRTTVSQQSNRSSTFSSIFPFDSDSVTEMKLGKHTDKKMGTKVPAVPSPLTVPQYGRKKVAWC